MTRTARCKFVVGDVTHHPYGGRTVKLSTQYDQTVPEDVAFTKATPSGEMSVRIDNPAVLDIFVPGAAVYIDITPVVEKEKASGLAPVG